ncbi:hypothetical protein DFH09DRAFT_1069611 [Mycena vulgaris]|nr:hypothetical protein DFH09DRAFT_1069611 [Mycena vulgaris]
MVVQRVDVQDQNGLGLDLKKIGSQAQMAHSALEESRRLPLNGSQQDGERQSRARVGMVLPWKFRGCTKAGKMAHGTLAGETAHSRSEAAHSDQCAAFEPEAALALFENVPPSCFEKARQNGSFRIKAHRRRHGLPGWRLGTEADVFSECCSCEMESSIIKTSANFPVCSFAIWRRIPEKRSGLGRPQEAEGKRQTNDPSRSKGITARNLKKERNTKARDLSGSQEHENVLTKTERARRGKEGNGGQRRNDASMIHRKRWQSQRNDSRVPVQDIQDSHPSRQQPFQTSLVEESSARRGKFAEQAKTGQPMAAQVIGVKSRQLLHDSTETTEHKFYRFQMVKMRREDQLRGMVAA